MTSRLTRRTAETRRAHRLLARVVLVVALGMQLLAPAFALAENDGYDHRWSAEDLYVGDIGETRKKVLDDSISLTLAKGEWTGRIRHRDVLGVTDSSEDVISQVALIDLRLTGSTLEGGASLGGRFEGSVTLLTAPAKGLSAALDPSLAEKSAEETVYDVSGYWAAELSGRTATGRLLYQSAVAQEGVTGLVRDASWFNRASLADAQGLGDPQSFIVETAGASAQPAAAEPRSATGSGGAPAPVSFMRYVLRGLSGRGAESAMPVTAEQLRAARALRDARPTGASPLPNASLAVDIDVAGAVLDAKNAAIGLLGEGGPRGSQADRARKAFDTQVAGVPPRPAAGEDQDLGLLLVKRIETALSARPGVQGAAALGSEVAQVGPAADATTIGRLRAWAAVAESLAGARAYGSSLSPSAELARIIAEKHVPSSGPAADAVLAAADSERAPASAAQVTEFERVASLDASSTTRGQTPVQRALAVQRAEGQVTPSISWSEAGGSRSVSPSRWLAYRRTDGRVYWLAGEEGPVAVTAGGVRGWVWSAESAEVVSAARVGRVLARVPLVLP